MSVGSQCSHDRGSAALVTTPHSDLSADPTSYFSVQSSSYEIDILIIHSQPTKSVPGSKGIIRREDLAAHATECQSANAIRLDHMSRNNMVSKNQSNLLEVLSKRLTDSGVNAVFQVDGEWVTYQEPHLIDPRKYGATQIPRALAPGASVNLTQRETEAILATIDRINQLEASEASEEATSSEREMASQKDDGVPWVKFPPKPEGWKGDPGNPNFKALGTLSAPIMRKIEPAGPHFLAYARRVSLGE